MSVLFARVVPPSTKETEPVGVPPDGDETVTLKVTTWPRAEGFGLEVDFVTVSSRPRPVSEIDCWGALSAIVTVAIRFPVTVGVNLTVMEQLVPGGVALAPR
jgi:hypothetical protein